MKNKERVEKSSPENETKEVSPDEFEAVMKRILSAMPKKKKRRERKKQ